MNLQRFVDEFYTFVETISDHLLFDIFKLQNFDFDVLLLAHGK
jgi:hypothetical protein